MTTPSNLYAEKIFAEHPLEMWALDEETSYLSWIYSTDQNMKEWGPDGTYSTSPLTIKVKGDIDFDMDQYMQSSVPFSQISQNQWIFPSSGSTQTYAIKSPALKFDASQIDPVSGYFSAGFQMFTNDESISKVSIGYLIDKSTDEVVYKDITNLAYGEWVNALEVFTKEPENSSYPVHMLIRVTVDPSVETSSLFINGLVFGQGAEYFGSSSLGISYSVIPDNVYLPAPFFSSGNPGEQREGIEISPYGLSDATGYYIIYNDFELVSQSGLPMIYGSNTSTVLNPTPNKAIPNIILPAKGFMNELNANKTRTFEFWMKLNHNGTSNSTRYKIFGPTASADGLYVDESFLILKIGNKVASTFVGEWARPMLVDVEVSAQTAQVMIDGSIQISMKHDGQFSKYKDVYDQDWVGFYCPSDIADSIEIDCVAVYSHTISEDVAKRRFVYGQGVEFPLALNSAYGGTSAYVDFSKSGYTKMHDYGNKANNKWETGISNNLKVDSVFVSAPAYSNPEIVYNDSPSGLKDFATWSSDNYDTMVDLSPSLACFKANPINSSNAYLRIPSLSSFYGNSIQAITGIVSVDSLDDGTLIMSIVNKTTLDKILVSIKTISSKKSIVYSVVKSGVERNVYAVDSDTRIGDSSKVIFGLVIDEFVAYANSLTQDIAGNPMSLKITNFYTPSALSVYIGGDSSTSKSIDARFSKLSMLTLEDLKKFKRLDPGLATSLSHGIFNYNNGQYTNIAILESLYSVYEIKPSYHYPENFVSIASTGYWADSIPVSKMMKSVFTDSAKTQTSSEVDFLQINMGYPSNIDSSLFKAYIYFQYSNLFNMSNDDFYSRTTTPLPDNEVVVPGTSWHQYKYEIKDGTIVYMPKDEGVSKPEGAPATFSQSSLIAIVRFEINIDSPKDQPIQIQKLQIAPVSVNYQSETPVSTRYGSQIVPSTLTDGVDTFKDFNPYRIYRGQTEYLYLTSRSGIELCSENDAKKNLYIPINKTLASPYRVSTIQFAFNHRGYFSEDPELAFRIESESKVIDFFVQSINADNTRAILIAKVGDQPFNDIEFFINGLKVRSPILKRGEWNMLGMSFSPAINFSTFGGKFRIFSRIIVNNFSYYQISEDLVNQYQVFKTWNQVQNESDAAESGWDYWLTNPLAAPNTWYSMEVTSESRVVSIPAADVYRIFAGTNKIVSDSRSDDMSFVVPYYQYVVYNNVYWRSLVIKPV